MKNIRGFCHIKDLERQVFLYCLFREMAREFAA